MRKSRLLAACAALTLIAAACGDDDDDAASSDTSTETIAAPAGGGTDAAAEPTLPGSGASDEQVADCEAVASALIDIGEGPTAPDVGEEISDEYKDALSGALESLEGVELQTDEVQAGVDALLDFGNEVLEADTWTEDLDEAATESITPLTNVCAATFAEIPTST
jgi:hypothetical protein